MDLEESYVKRAMMANAAEVVAVSSADKLGSAGPYVIGPLEELTHLVTERSASPDQLDAYRAAGAQVVCDAPALWAGSDIVFKVRAPSA